MPTSRFLSNRLQVSNTTPTKFPNPMALTEGVQIRAESANTGNIYVGGTDLAAASSYFIKKDETLFIPIEDLKYVWFLADVNNEAIRYFAI